MNVEVDDGIALVGLILVAVVVIACLTTAYYLLAPQLCVAEALA